LTNELVDVGSNFDSSVSLPPDAESTTESGPDDAAEPIDAPRAPADSPAEADANADTGPAPIVRDLCIPNPSFEIAPDDEAGVVVGTGTPVLTAPPGWQACSGSTSATASMCSLEPTNGNTCLGLSVGFPFLILPASVDFVPCAAVEAGATYSLTVDVALDAPGADGGQSGEPPLLQLRGSNTACDPQGDLLWRFSGVSASCGWKTLCGTFVPVASYTHLLLVPETSSSTALAFLQTEVLVDDLRPVDACPSR